MATSYTYMVRDRTGKQIAGSLEAENADVLAGKLRQMGYIVVSIKEVREKVLKREIRLFGGRIKTKDVGLFTRQFATMLSAGLPLSRCLRILTEQVESAKFTDIIEDVHREVEAGRSLSEALSRHPEAFSKLYISMVKAGEVGGMLDDVLLRVATHMERDQEIKRKVKSAMTYPIVVLGVMVILVAAIMIFIIPRFAKMFEEIGAELPSITKLVVGISHFVAGWGGLAIVVFIVLLVMGFRAVKKNDKGREKIDSIKLKIPLVGSLFQKISLSRFSRTLSALISAGVPILGALEITGEAAGNMVVTNALEDVRMGVKEGETIARPLSAHAVFPPMVTQMIAIGEETGALDVLLAKVSDFYDMEVGAAVDSLTSTIEPLLIFILGGVVGFFVIAIYMPIFRFISAFK